MEKKEKPKFNETDVYRVRRESKLIQGVFLCKVILKKHGTVQIEGMGQCISLVAKISQILIKNGLAIANKISSENVQIGGSRSINPKLTIKMSKTQNFDQQTDYIVLKS